MNSTTAGPPSGGLLSTITTGALPLLSSVLNLSWTTLLTILIPSYLLLVRHLRFQRLRSLRTRFPQYFSSDGVPSPSTLSTMTLQDAHFSS